MTAPQDATLDALLDAYASAHRAHGYAEPADRSYTAEMLKEVRADLHAHFAASAQTAAGGVSETTQRLIDMLRQRDAAGRAKYGTTLDRSDMTHAQWTQHLVEELLDGAGYALRMADTEQQPAAPTITDEMVERACKKYAFREDGATWPDAYSEYEVRAERVLMREFLTHAIGAPAALRQQSPANPHKVETDEDEDAYVIDMLGKTLARIAIAVKGPEECLRLHSYHDLPELVEALVAASPTNRTAMPEGDMHRALEWMCDRHAPGSYLDAIEEAVAAYDPARVGADTVCRTAMPEVTEAMIDAARAAFFDVAEPKDAFTDHAPMRAAIVAALAAYDPAKAVGK